MKKFLEQITDELIERHGKQFVELCIVLPNRRAGLFLKKYLSEKLRKTSFVPEIYSIEDFITKISGVEIIDDISILIRFYKIYKSINPANAETFNEFINWAQVVLADFNEIDMYLVDAANLFAYLNETKLIENWSPDKKELTDFQKKYLSFWNSLGQLYEILKQQLLSENKAYDGLSYRIVSENTEDRTTKYNWHKIIFVGFNALTKAEEKIIKNLIKSDKAEIVWDADSYYTDNENHEAGFFLRKYKKTFLKNSVFKTSNYFSDNEKEIEITGVTKNVGQAKATSEIIKNKNLFDENTAVVLADENLLFPVLNSLPSEIKNLNVTMGYPLINSPLYSLIENLFMLHENAIKFASLTNAKSYRFYNKDIVRIFKHPYLNFNNDLKNIYKKISDFIIEKNKVYLSYSDIFNCLDIFEKTKFEKTAEILFSKWNSAVDCLKAIGKIINSIKDDLNENNITTNEILFAFRKIIWQLEPLTEEPEIRDDINTFHNIFGHILKFTKIPFYGEPLKGLQIMGMLETRNLDFENVFILSSNEGKLPAGKTENSFIPFDIKLKFGLPTHRDKDSIFAYHFFRLLQRAKNIHILYNSDIENFGKGEKSRFISQLLYEQKENPKINLVQKILLSDIPFYKQTDIAIKKNEKIIQALKNISESGLSPSALNTYINCSLQFYLKFIAKLEEPEEIKEEIESDKFGSVIHKVLRKIYSSFINKILEIEELKKVIPEIETLVKKAIEAENAGEISYGKNLLIAKVANKFIKNFISYEINFIQELEKKGGSVKIFDVEKYLSTTVDINNPDFKNIVIKGIIDRIDSIGNTTRIIDYKTGKVTKTELKPAEWSDIITDKKYEKAFQLLTYAYLFSKRNLNKNNIKTGIIPLGSISNGFMPVEIPHEENNFKSFEEQLIILATQIFDSEISFKQTEKADNCKYCDFKGICNR
ncbi:MAG: PD-(D/E)XK nuclease family protein [Bacteroidales bacterium]|jgi:CRISPR/Cas system-associated exonuclease Cas4 (RecB family)